MAIYDPNNNQHSDGRDSEASFYPKDKIPTAEEHFKEYFKGAGYTTQVDLIAWGNAWAKVHVEAALKAAAKKAKWDAISDFAADNLKKTDCAINKESILSAYPLNLIK